MYFSYVQMCIRDRLKPYPEQELHSEPVRCDFMHEVAADPGILVPA